MWWKVKSESLDLPLYQHLQLVGELQRPGRTLLLVGPEPSFALSDKQKKLTLSWLQISIQVYVTNLDKVFQFKVQDIFYAYISIHNEQDSGFWSIHSLHFGSVVLKVMYTYVNLKTYFNSMFKTRKIKYMHIHYIKMLSQTKICSD